jgi:F-type H+-transporting ATPase subunit gamma
MANPRVLDKRRKSIRNIRKITRTMELIATARFKKAMDRASAATAYTDRITRLVADLTQADLDVRHPLLAGRETTARATLLVLTANRGLCGGYNGNVIRAAARHWQELTAEIPDCRLEISGKRGISGFKFRRIVPHEMYTHFEDRPRFDEVELIANRYLEEYITGRLDRLDVVYMKFHSASKQDVAVETLLPLGSLTGAAEEKGDSVSGMTAQYEFLPSPESILEEVVPTSFKVKLFKCFLDAAVSEQIARMVAMKSATENADELIRHLSMEYNRARQGRITSELMDIVGGVEALK